MKHARFILLLITTTSILWSITAHAESTPQSASRFGAGAGNYELSLNADCIGGDVIYSCPRSRVVTKWSYTALQKGIRVQLKVYKHVADKRGGFVAESPIEVTSAAGVNEFLARIPLAQGQEVYGGIASFTADGIAAGPVTLTSSDPQIVATEVFPAPGAGDSFPIAETNTGQRVNLTATVEPDDDRDGFGDKTQDSDDDNDGLLDDVDSCPLVASTDQSNLDGDSAGDVCDFDDDGDGALDDVELRVKSNPRDRDSDDDGIIDLEEGFTSPCIPGCDKPAKYKTSPTNADSDGDGIKDGVELGIKSGVTAQGGAPGTDTSKFTADRDPKKLTNPLKKDSDGDGIRDGKEDKNHNGRRDRGETDPLLKDTDRDGLSDRRDPFPTRRARH